MAAAYCDVAVPLPLHETFTYKIPARLNTQVCAGCRVAVPFGSRKLVGVVTALLDVPRVTGPLKEVEALLDVEPVLPASLLALGHWVSEYTRRRRAKWSAPCFRCTMSSRCASGPACDRSEVNAWLTSNSEANAAKTRRPSTKSCIC